MSEVKAVMRHIADNIRYSFVQMQWFKFEMRDFL